MSLILSDEQAEKLINACNQNIWLKNFGEYPRYDYPYEFCQISDMDELIKKFRHGNWGIRQGFLYGGLAFVQQVNGGDEWLALKQENGEWHSFDSISLEHILQRKGDEGFREYMEELLSEEGICEENPIKLE